MLPEFSPSMSAPASIIGVRASNTMSSSGKNSVNERHCFAHMANAPQKKVALFILFAVFSSLSCAAEWGHEAADV